MTRSKRLRQMITSSDLEFLMEAHSGLSAKIVEEAGFAGIWASGLSISAQLGVRDNNEASWTQILEILEFMTDATSLPILLDGDTGFGNFNNMRRLVRKLEQRQVAGVCIEDKLFPKTNSFIAGESQPLADIDEFSGKIKAGKDSQNDDSFSIVARVEAFIAGWGLAEALRRAEAYRIAGADAILVHSKRSDATEIAAFMKEWAGRHPVIIVPTKYYSVPTSRFRDLGVSIAIWANHNVRASIQAMQNVSRRIFAEQSLASVEEHVATVAEVFRLQGADELKTAEKKYLPASGKCTNGIILAASRGERLGDLTAAVPKALLRVGGRTLLETQLEHFNQLGVKDITVVRGYRKDTISAVNFKVVDNDRHETTKEVYSLYLAREEIKGVTFVTYGDIVYKRFLLHDLLNNDDEIAIVVDGAFEQQPYYQDFVKADRPYGPRVFEEPVSMLKMASTLDAADRHGEFFGLMKVGEKGAKALRETLETMASEPDFAAKRMPDLLNRLCDNIGVSVIYCTGSWLDIDDVASLQKATNI